MTDTATTIKKVQDMSPRQRWQTEIEAACKALKKFYDRGDAATKRYLDERELQDAELKKFNIFYANTAILESSLYSQTPKPVVGRKYADYQDQIGRVGGMILERCLSQDFNDPRDQFDSVMMQAVQDRLLPGLGTAWLRLETDTDDIPESEGGSITNETISTSPGPAGDDNGFPVPAAEAAPSVTDPDPVGEDVPLKKVRDQRVMVDYVYWRDFLWSPCRVWSERRWVARRVPMSYDQLKDRFGKEKADLTSLDYSVTTISDSQTNTSTPKQEVFQKAWVWEIWDREARKVHWYAEGYGKDLLDSTDDFLQLTDFDPCPRPMLANITTSNTVPRPDYYMIQDQYNELDTINARISLLVSAVKVVGVYDKRNATELSNILGGAENRMYPVDNWAQFAEKGGVKGVIDWVPLDQIVLALEKLQQAREAIKGQIYELTGIADIVRGASKASETLGAQQIKAQFASVRIKKLQKEVERFASDILRLKAEIMVKHFTPEVLINKSGITVTDNDEYIPAAIAMIKSEQGFQWRIVVQPDSMAQADYSSDKADRIEFASAITGYLSQALPMTEQIPDAKPIVLGTLRWLVSAFKGADDIQGMVDKQLALMEGKPPAPKPPDPKIQALQMKGQQDAEKAQRDAAKDQAEMEMDQQRFQMEQQTKQMELSFAQQMQQMEMAMARFELMMKQAELRFKQQEHTQDLEFRQVEGQQDLQMQEREHVMNLETQEVQNAQSIAHDEQSHELAMKQAKAKPQGDNK